MIFEVTPKFKTNLGGHFMTKLSKQDKIQIFFRVLIIGFIN